MSVSGERERRFVQRVIAVRKRLGWTAVRLCNECGIPRVALSKIEHGTRRLSLDEAFAICEALDVSIADMMSEKPVALRVQIEEVIV